MAEAGEDPPDASTAGGADKRRRGGDAGEGAVVGVTAGLARLGEATVGEAMPAGAGETGSRGRPRGAGGGVPGLSPGSAGRGEVRAVGRLCEREQRRVSEVRAGGFEIIKARAVMSA